MKWAYFLFAMLCAFPLVWCFQVVSTQTVYEDCNSLYGSDTLKVVDQNTGKCICPYSTQSAGQEICGSGSTFSLDDCKCQINYPKSPTGPCPGSAALILLATFGVVKSAYSKK
jgi:hypothetical protein